MPSPATIIISILLLAVVAILIRYLWRQHKKGGCSACGGSCGSCGGGCDCGHSEPQP